MSNNISNETRVIQNQSFENIDKLIILEDDSIFFTTINNFYDSLNESKTIFTIKHYCINSNKIINSLDIIDSDSMGIQWNLYSNIDESDTFLAYDKTNNLLIFGLNIYDEVDNFGQPKSNKSCFYLIDTKSLKLLSKNTYNNSLNLFNVKINNSKDNVFLYNSSHILEIQIHNQRIEKIKETPLNFGKKIAIDFELGFVISNFYDKIIIYDLSNGNEINKIEGKTSYNLEEHYEFGTQYKGNSEYGIINEFDYNNAKKQIVFYSSNKQAVIIFDIIRNKIIKQIRLRNVKGMNKFVKLKFIEINSSLLVNYNNKTEFLYSYNDYNNVYIGKIGDFISENTVPYIDLYPLNLTKQVVVKRKNGIELCEL